MLSIERSEQKEAFSCQLEPELIPLQQLAFSSSKGPLDMLQNSIIHVLLSVLTFYLLSS